MKKKVLFLSVCCVCFYDMIAQITTLPPSARDELKEKQAEMFDCFSNGDADCFLKITGEDYRTINADGGYLDREGMASLLHNFKGSTYKILNQTDRFYNSVAISTGRMQFFIKSILVADVHFTQIWEYRNDRWVYIGWQGTMTGAPKNYPLYVTIFVLAALASIIIIIRWFRKRNKKRKGS